MTEHNLGSAEGDVTINYHDDGLKNLDNDLRKTAKSAGDLEQSLDRTSKKTGQARDEFGRFTKASSDATTQTKRLGDAVQETGEKTRLSGTAMDGYRVRLREASAATADAERAEKSYKAALLDSMSTVADIARRHEEHERALKRQEQASKNASDAHRALHSELSVGQRVIHGLSDLIPNLHNHFIRLGQIEQDVSHKTNTLAKGLGIAAKAAAVLGPQGRAASVGLEVLSKGIDKAGQSAATSSSHIAGFVQNIASFEVAFGKIAGMALALPSVGGLAGLGGASAVQGLVNMADAVRQLSGLLGLLPATIAGVGFSMGTLQVAFHGVGDALKDMMADDPKKFLEDIAHMGPVAGQAMLQIAQFRGLFLAGGAAVQDSFFSKIAADIAPLVQTWAPAIISAMSQVSGVFGSFADQLAKMMLNPQSMQVFEGFIDNLTAGMHSLQPAIAPLVTTFSILTQVGSSFFSQVGDKFTNVIKHVFVVVQQAASSGALQQWIQTGINAFGHLINIVTQFGSAFNTVMNVAETFGGGGLLGWLDQVTAKFAAWTQSAEGQKTLQDFFSSLRQATDAFLPMLQPLVAGLSSLITAFVKLGIGIAPGWQTFFDTFASTMAQLSPQIQGMAPALNSFLTGLSQAFEQLMAQVGPQLPQMFSALANAFLALLPQLQPLTDAFIRLVTNVGPQLPTLFTAVTDALNALTPLMPVIIELTREFTSVVTILVKILGGLVEGVRVVNDALGKHLPKAIRGIWDSLGDFFGNLPSRAAEWGKNLVQGLIRGMLDSTGLTGLGGAAKNIVDRIANWFQSSPAKMGPFSGSGYTLLRGQKMVQDMASGMLSARGAVESAASATAAAAAGGLAGGPGGRAPFAAGMEAAGGALLPDHIAAADTGILDAYLRHEFDDSRGLKGLAKDLGNLIGVFQSGFNLLAQQGAQQVMQTLMSMPFAQQQTWRKIPADVFARQQAAELQRKAQQQGPQWTDVLGPSGAPGVAGVPGGPQQTPLNVTASSSKEQIQRAIIAAGRARGLSDEAIQTALAVAAAESGFNPTISGGVQGSAGLVSGLFQQSPSSGWGTLEQVNDPNYAINAFYNAFVKQLANNPSNPLLAAVLTQNPQLGSGAQGSDYMNAVMRQLGLAQSIMAAQGKAGWAPLTGGTGAPGIPVTGMPTPSTVSNLPDVRGAHPQLAYALAAVQALFPGATLNAGKDDHGVDQGWHPRGQAIDIGAPGNNPQMLASIANWLLQFAPSIEELIFSGPGITQNIKSGRLGPAIDMPGSVYSSQQAGYHGDHIHLAVTDQMAQAFEAALMSGSFLPPGKPAGLGQLAGRGGITLPSGKTLDQFVDPNTGKVYSGNDLLLRQYLQSNPALAAQIAAAQQPGAPQQQVLDALNGIDTAITGLRDQDAITNQNTISALQSTQSQIAQSQGFQQGPNAMQMFATAMGGASNIASSIMQSIQSGLDSLAATQDIADRLVYGIRNTEDINAIVDNVQKYITLAANIAQTTGSILSTIGGIVGAGGSGDTSGSSQAASMALSAAGQIAQLISGVIQGVNAAIDFGQQVYHIAGTYVGRLLSNLVAGPFGTPLMGDVRFLLNQNTGQLISYSRDNPGNQNALNIPPWMSQALGYGGGNSNPQVNQQLNVYAGPGQPVGEMVREVVWMVDTAPSGAMAAQNF